MNAEQYTRCPHCKSTFEVTESQLSAASGKVRCGACMEVFDALAYLINSHAESDREIEAADIPEDELSANVDRDNTPDAPDVAEQAP
ncbi:MJ0042-type zinc finger domain-containing protein, partial [Oleiphilus sp. HI0079]